MRSSAAVEGVPDELGEAVVLQEPCDRTQNNCQEGDRPSEKCHNACQLQQNEVVCSVVPVKQQMSGHRQML